MAKSCSSTCRLDGVYSAAAGWKTGNTTSIHPGDLALLGPPVDGGHAQLGVGQQLGGESAEGADDPRLDDGDLVHEMRAAGLDLVRERVPVVGRAALDHVGDVDVGPGEAYLAEQAR